MILHITIRAMGWDREKCLERMEKNMRGGIIVTNVFKLVVGTHSQRLKGLVTAGIPGSLFQLGINRKDMS